MNFVSFSAGKCNGNHKIFTTRNVEETYFLFNLSSPESFRFLEEVAFVFTSARLGQLVASICDIN